MMNASGCGVETCDNQDNDCDQKIDEDVTRAGVVVGADRAEEATADPPNLDAERDPEEQHRSDDAETQIPVGLEAVDRS